MTEWLGFEERYIIRAAPEGDYAVSFDVVKVVAVDTLGRVYFRNEDGGEITDYASAETFLYGSIKWDGCSNWDFHTGDCMAHFCGRRDATGIGRLMDHLYDLAREYLGPKFDEKLAA